MDRMDRSSRLGATPSTPSIGGGATQITVLCEAELSVKSSIHLLTASTRSDSALLIDVEEIETGARWKGEFSKDYIEDVTHKTGSYKPHHVFVEMLVSAMTGASEAVYVDLFTYADLEALKAKSAGNTSAVNTSHASASSAKSAQLARRRYLILTYCAEFDRVHFPLPLAYLEVVEAAAMQATIRRLRGEIASLRAAAATASKPSLAETLAQSRQAAEVDSLRAENGRLRAQLETAAVECDQLAQQVEAMADARNPTLDEARRDVKQANRRMAEMARRHEAELADADAAIARLERELRARPVAAPSGGGGAGSASSTKRRRAAGAPRVSPRPSPRASPKPASPKGAARVRRRRDGSSVKPRAPRSRSSSPAQRAAPAPRFDPTAFVAEQKERRRKTAAARPGSASRGGRRSSLSSAGSGSDAGSDAGRGPRRRLDTSSSALPPRPAAVAAAAVPAPTAPPAAAASAAAESLDDISGRLNKLKAYIDSTRGGPHY